MEIEDKKEIEDAHKDDTNTDGKVEKSQRRIPANEEKDLNLTEIGYQMRNALMLAVAYSANVGGTGVVTGTSPNLIMVDVLHS